MIQYLIQYFFFIRELGCFFQHFVFPHIHSPRRITHPYQRRSSLEDIEWELNFHNAWRSGFQAAPSIKSMPSYNNDLFIQWTREVKIIKKLYIGGVSCFLLSIVWKKPVYFFIVLFISFFKKLKWQNYFLNLNKSKFDCIGKCDHFWTI